MAPTSKAIAEGWLYSLTNANGTDTGDVKVGEWAAVQNFPTTVHVELLQAKKIPDPVRRPTRLLTVMLTGSFSSSVLMNGKFNVSLSQSRSAVWTLTVIQGVGECDWSFKTTFAVDQNEYDAENIDLVFQGLDTFASIELVSMCRCMRRLIINMHGRFLSERKEDP